MALISLIPWMTGPVMPAGSVQVAESQYYGRMGWLATLSIHWRTSSTVEQICALIAPLGWRFSKDDCEGEGMTQRSRCFVHC